MVASELNSRAPWASTLATLGASIMTAILLGCGGGGGSSTNSQVINQSCGADSYLPNYVGDVATNSGQLLRWSAFPVSVAYYTPETWSPEMKVATDAALASWNSTSGGKINFVVTTDTTTADITIKWELTETLGGSTVGLTTLSFSSTTIKDADIRVAAYGAPFVQRSLSDLTEIVTHEMGHALGIGGHSSTKTDLMYPYINPASPDSPNGRDWNTLRTAYCDDFRARSRGVLSGPLQTVTFACPLGE